MVFLKLLRVLVHILVKESKVWDFYPTCNLKVNLPAYFWGFWWKTQDSWVRGQTLLCTAKVVAEYQWICADPWASVPSLTSVLGECCSAEAGPGAQHSRTSSRQQSSIPGFKTLSPCAAYCLCHYTNCSVWGDNKILHPCRANGNTRGCSRLVGTFLPQERPGRDSCVLLLMSLQC